MDNCLGTIVKSNIAIVTVCLNAEESIAATLRSVMALKDESIKYIVIDGGSTDNTLAILDTYSKCIDILIVGKDKGLYDAMNIGASYAPPGSYIIWLNSGDMLLKKPQISEKWDAYFYGVRVFDIYSKLYAFSVAKHWQARTARDLIFPSLHHQGFVVKKEIFQKYLYDLDVGICADLYCMMNVVSNHKCKFIDDFFIDFKTGGLSDHSNVKKIVSYYKISKKFKFNSFLFVILNTDKLLRIMIKSILPRHIVLMIRKINIHLFSKY